MTVPPPLPPLPEDLRKLLPETVTYDGLRLHVDRFGWSRGAIGAVMSRTYEFDERKLVGLLVQPSDRVIEMGTGLGLVAMVAKRRCKPGQVSCFEANPEMIEEARRNFLANNAEIGLNQSILVCRRARAGIGETVRFKIGENFLTSAISPVYPAKGEVEVPAGVLEDAIAEQNANVLILDVEGDELNVLGGAELAPIRLIISEIHFDTIGNAGFQYLAESLAAQGLAIDWRHTRGSTFAFRRDVAADAIGMDEYLAARAAESAGDMKAAAAKYERLLDRAPTCLHLRMAAASCNMAAKDYGAAISILEPLNDSDKLDPDVATTLAISLLRQQSHGAMEALLRKAISKGTATPPLWGLLGRAMAAQNKFHGALNCYRKSIELNPIFGLAYRDMAAALRKLDRPEEATTAEALAQRLQLPKELEPAASE